MARPGAGGEGEQQHQEWLFDAIRAHEARYPDLALAFHVPNEGQRHPAVGAKLRRQGLKSGLPDVLLPVARRGAGGAVAYIGCAVELKTRTGRVSERQRWWLAELARAGWYTAICRGWQAALDTLLAYLREEAGAS